MKKLLTFLFVVVIATSIVFADNIDKLSAGTQMFLSERRGEIKLPKLKEKIPVVEANDTMVLFMDETLKEAKMERQIAESEMINGIEMISAFVRVKGGGFGAIEGMGAVMQTKFNDNLAAMLLPVDKIEKIADLDYVVNIEVAEILKPVNDRQRTVTQAVDAITNSAAAQALGLTKQYTGKNVILGIIDTGIDFKHIAFRDKNGNNRIVRAYKLSGSNSTSLTTYSSSSDINNLTYDTNSEDHGTHTSTTAGGSSVIVDGNNVTVTDDHANATYGGMAPEADLVIAGLSSLYTTSIGSAIQNICNYADQVGKPCVISLSLGSQAGPHDGTGTIANIVDQCAGNNHIIVYAASNDAMRANYFVEHGTSSGGGSYASGTSTNSKPMMANLQKSWADATGNVQLYSSTIYAYARTANVATALKFHVVDTSTGNVVYSTNEYTSSSSISVSGSNGLAKYFKASSSSYGSSSISVTRSTINGKYYWSITAPTLVSQSYSQNSSGIYESNYALCVSVYPTNNTSTIIDMWEGSRVNWFGNDLTLSSSASNSYNLVQGNDDCSVSDNACYSKVISVGAYVTRNSVTNYAGTVTDASDEYPNIGDHAYFSSWQSAGFGPLGTALPHINAPGARIIAGVNHYHTKSVDNYSYWADDYIGDLIVNNTNYPYAAMEGTSMATPCVSGIIAQWLQACVEAGKTPSPDYIKEVMAATWDTDQWTNGAGHGAKTFGTHGKINAIKGIQYILGCSGGPVITASPESLTFSGNTGQTYTRTVTVSGSNLQGSVTAAISGANASMFSVSPTTISMSNATSGATVTVTYSPTSAGTHTANLVFTSNGADAVTIPITGTAVTLVPTINIDKNAITIDSKVNESKTATFNVKGENLNGDISVAFTQNDNNAFSKNVSSITVAQAQNSNGYDVTVTFTPHALGTHNGKIKLTSNGATDVYVNLTGNVLEPSITVTSDELHIYSAIGRSATRTFTVKGQNLSQDITVSLENDENNAFAVDKNSISIEEAESDEGCKVTVTFSPASDSEDEYLGIVTLSSGSVEEMIMLVGGITEPTIVADDELSIHSRLNGTKTESFTVLGESLSGPVTVTLNDENGVFTLGKDEIRIEEAESDDGGLVPVTFAPTSFVEDYYSATVTLTTPHHEPLVVALKGYVNEPQLVASIEELVFNSDLNTSVTKAIGVLGSDLIGDVNVTLEDPSGVFTIDNTSISITDAEAGANINVTFNSSTEGTFFGTVKLQTNGVDPVEVSLTATANDGGTASDAYLNIAKYATIDEAGWNHTFVNKLYEYTEYESNDGAWLTMPVYGAFVGARYATNSTQLGSGQPQKWIECSLNATNTYGATAWNSNATYTNPFYGNTAYFTGSGSTYPGGSVDGNARAIGYNSRTNTSIRSVSFYVTNTTRVMVYGTGRNGASSSYPARLRIYECTKNADGTLATSNSTVANKTSSSTSTFTLDATNLDATKIYKVEVSIYRGYLYEIGFCTPLPEKVTLDQIISDPNVIAGKQYRIDDDNLIAAYLSNDERSIYCKDDNGYADKLEIQQGQTDFMVKQGWQTTDWDQSNWIVLNLPNGKELTQVPTGHKLTGVRGTLENKVNPTIQLTKLPKNGDEVTVNLNNYLATNFDPVMLAQAGNYFFIPAKPMEVVNVMWAKWDEANSRFVVAEPVNNSIGIIDGAFYADFSRYNDPSNGVSGTMEDGGVYNFIGIGMVNVNNVANTTMGITTLDENNAGMVVYPLSNWDRKDKNPDGTITDIHGIFTDCYREVVGVDYVNIAGVTSSKPFQGMNIVVTRYSDGSRTTVKQIFK